MILSDRKNPMRRTRMVKHYHSVKTRQGLKDALDEVTSLIVRKRDGQCVTCGTTEDLTCSHFYKRVWINTRWNLINCNAQCFPCNALHNERPWPYTNYFMERYGPDAMHELFTLRNSTERPTNEDLRKLLEEHRALLRSIS